MPYHRLETREGDRFYREAGAGEPIVFLCRLMVQHISANENGKRSRQWRPRGILGAALQPAKAAS
jgi:hypothetical protein